MLGKRRRRWLPVAAMLAAAYVGGWISAEAARRPAPVPAGSRYVLFLHGEARTPDSVAAHRRWALDLAARGVMIGGVKPKPSAEARETRCDLTRIRTRPYSK